MKEQALQGKIFLKNLFGKYDSSTQPEESFFSPRGDRRRTRRRGENCKRPLPEAACAERCRKNCPGEPWRLPVIALALGVEFLCQALPGISHIQSLRQSHLLSVTFQSTALTHPFSSNLVEDRNTV
ncbi:hypothetical protein ACJJTC_015636 [Scirpophaga incertulas]